VRSSLAWHQAWEALRLEGGLRLIKRRTGAAEGLRRPRHRVTVDIDPSEHFVFHLDQIARVEKLVGSKQRVLDGLGVGGPGIVCLATLRPDIRLLRRTSIAQPGAVRYSVRPNPGGIRFTHRRSAGARAGHHHGTWVADLFSGGT
jgi:hypothetical protein